MKGYNEGSATWYGKPPPDPILIPCEGSRCNVHALGMNFGMCQMCGQIIERQPDGRAIDHQRQDLIAMLERGDFG